MGAECSDTTLAICLMGGINIGIITYLMIDDPQTEEKCSKKYIHIQKNSKSKYSKKSMINYRAIDIPLYPSLSKKKLNGIYSQIRNKSYKDMHQIIPNLYLGNAISAGHIQSLNCDDYQTAIDKQRYKLKSLGINNIISCIHADNIYENKKDFTYLNIPFYDNIQNKEAYELDNYLSKAIRFIKRSIDNDEGVLVHCQAGVSRSASIVIAYIMAEYKWTFLKSYLFVRGKRNIIDPNPTFKKCLIKYEKLLMDMNDGKLSDCNIEWIT